MSSRYCPRCKVVVSGDALCDHHRRQLAQSPQLLADAVTFAEVAGQQQLVTTQALDQVARGVNKLAGSNLSWEGAHQYAHDLRVFSQLNIDPYCRSGVFSSAQSAQTYFEAATKGQIDTLGRKLAGTTQEVRWLLEKQGELSSVLHESSLVGGNAPGVDGQTIHRLTGEVITRTTVKATQNAASGLSTNVNGVVKAIAKGTVQPTDTFAGVAGSEEKLRAAMEKAINAARQSGDVQGLARLEAAKNLKVIEISAPADVAEDVARQLGKIADGVAAPEVTLEAVGKHAIDGAIVGAVICVGIASITEYLRYRDGETSRDEAFANVGQAALKGAIVGAGTKVISALFLPAGPVGFVAGVAVGIYLNAAATNVLDEIFGKGAYAAILHGSGFVLGTTMNLAECVEKVAFDQRRIAANTRQLQKLELRTRDDLDEFERLINGVQ